MNQVVAVFLLPLLIAFCHANSNSNSTGNTNLLNDCTKENDGHEKKVLNGWATCHNGRYVMTACQADDGSRIDIGLTVRQRGFVFECSQSSTSADTPLSLRPVACIRQKNKPQDSIVVEEGHRVKDPPFIYECVRIRTWDPNSSSLSLKAVACASNTSDIPDGGTVYLGSFTYNCSRQSGSLTNTVREVFLEAKGCLVNGKEYALDERAIIGNFVYKCRLTGGWPSSALEFATIGCANEGRRYEENEKYYTTRTNGSNYRYIIQCRHKDNKWSADPVGCLQDGPSPIEHSLGDTWTDNGGPGDPRLKYIMTCRADATSVTAIATECVYQPNEKDPSSAVTINPGCMRKFSKPNALVKCNKPTSANEGVSSEVLYRLNLNKVEQDALAAGFKNC